ncbi:extracellular solute-binding protein [Paenibacillus sp. GCM10027626]|uniref:extracellular solute-binding protein n=1 Tax=Paenibacillus sp. GCM10027626 TaxID=3273411 RepID=UPI003640F0D2
MYNRLTRQAVLAMVLTLMVSLFAACANTKEKNPATTGEDSSTETPSGTEKSNHFTLYHPLQTTPINLDGAVTKAVMEKMGVVWDKVEIGNGGDVAQQINLKLVGGDLPDAIILNADHIMWSRLIDEKRLLPLDKYFDNAEEYPNLAKIDKRILDYWRAADGHIYFVPTGYEPIIDEPSAWQGNAQGLWIQDDILKKSGVSKDSLKTVAGFENYLEAVKTMKDSQGRNMIPLSLGGENFAGLEVVMSMFGVKTLSGGTGWNEQADGAVIPDYKTPGFKKGFQWLHKLQLKGLLDPETAFHKRDLFMEKVNNLRFGATLSNGWDNPNIATLKNNGVPDSITYKELEKRGFPKGWFSPVYLPANDGVPFAQYANFSPFGGLGTGISAKTENPDILMKGLDWLHTEEAFILMEYGPQELGAYKMEDGVVVVDDSVFRGPEFWGGDAGGMNNVTEKGFWWWKNLGGALNTHIKTMEPPWPATNAMLYKAEEINHEQGTFGLIPVANRVKPVVGGSVEKYSPVQNDIRLQYYAKLLLAKNDKEFESAYEQFLKEMKVRGHDEETIAEFNEQYKAYANTPAGKIAVEVKRSLPRNVYSDKAEIIGQ